MRQIHLEIERALQPREHGMIQPQYPAVPALAKRSLVSYARWSSSRKRVEDVLKEGRGHVAACGTITAWGQARAGDKPVIQTALNPRH